MKKKILLLMGVFSFGILNAQIGINTDTPQALFHVDGSKDNSTTPTATELRNDLIITNDGRIGIGKIPYSSAQLELGSSKKALSLNNVSLQSTTDAITVLSPQQGTTVYNTNTSVDKTIQPDMHTFDGTKWFPLLTKSHVDNETVFYNLKKEQNTKSMSQADINTNNYSKGTLLVFYSKTSTGTTEKIIMPESGTYVFSVRLYGNPPNASQKRWRIPYYIYMVRASDGALLDSAICSLFVAGDAGQQSYNLFLQGVLNAGEEVKFYIGHSSSYPNNYWTLYTGPLTSYTRASRTSLLFWKIG